MPGYVIHLAEAKLILNTIGQNRILSYEWIQRFMTGTLLPDTRLKEEKRISHFWNPEELDQLALAPDLARFTGKYGMWLKDPVVLGYLAHLHLDACYVNGYWPKVIEFYGKNGHHEVMRERITDVEVLHLHRKIPVDRFFSKEYYYGEYTKLNSYFINKYNLSLPEWRLVGPMVIDEVNLRDMERVCQELNHLLAIHQDGDERHIQVFDLDELEEFIRHTADTFVKTYVQ